MGQGVVVKRSGAIASKSPSGYVGGVSSGGNGEGSKQQTFKVRGDFNPANYQITSSGNVIDSRTGKLALFKGDEQKAFQSYVSSIKIGDPRTAFTPEGQKAIQQLSSQFTPIPQKRINEITSQLNVKQEPVKQTKLAKISRAFDFNLRGIGNRLDLNIVKLEKVRQEKGKPLTIGEIGKGQTFQRLSQDVKNYYKSQIANQGLILLDFGKSGVNTIIGVKNIPSGVRSFIKDPKNIIPTLKGVTKEEIKNAKKFLKSAPSNPQRAIAKIGSEYLVFRGTDKGIKVLGKLTSNVATRLDPLFVGVAREGKEFTLKGGGKIKVVERGIPEMTLAEQVGLAGKKITAVSSQRDKLIKLLRTKKVVRKPIQFENLLSKNTKKLLKKFDKKTITSKELGKLDLAIMKETGSKGILERSFFADPKARVRITRLGIESESLEASLLDVLKGKANFRSNKPQILIFKDVRVQSLPKSFNTIRRKLKKNIPLSEKEANRFLAYQQKVTGKFKPIGFRTTEAEVTLASGETIKKIKRVGSILVNGKRVPIISVKPVKLAKTTKNLIKKAELGKLSKKEAKSLRRKLKKETGFKYTSSSIKAGKKYPLGRKISTLSSKAISSKRLSRRILSKPKFKKGVSKPKIRKVIKKITYKVRIPKRVKYKGRIPKKVTYRIKKVTQIVRIPKKIITKSPPIRGRIPKKPPVRRKTLKAIKREQKKKLKVGYDVFGRTRGKLIKLNTKPLSELDARRRGAYAIDNSTSRTFLIKKNPTRVKNFGSVKSKEKNYITKGRLKLREFRVRKGKKITLQKKYIEKTRYAIDTRGEKRQLSLSRLAKREGFGSYKTPKSKKKRK